MATNNSANFGTGTIGQVLTSNGTGVAPTFQAAPGVASLSQWANVSSTFYSTVTPYSTLSGGALSASRTWLIPFSTGASFTLTSLGIVCSTYSSPDTVRLGIYTMNQGTGAATLLTDFGTISVTATGFFSASSLTQAITPGFYYLAVNLNTNHNNYNTLNSAPSSVVTSSGVLVLGFLYNNGAGTLPSSITQANLNGTYQSNPILTIIQGH